MLAISEPRNSGDEIRTYRFDLDSGNIESKQLAQSAKPEVEIHKHATGGVSCYQSPHLPSPDGRFVAHCEGPFPGLPRDAQSDFIVVEDRSGKQIFKQGVWHKFRIIGYAWSPDSSSLAIAESSSHTSLRPLDLLGALAGHPIPEYTFYLILYRIDGKAAWRLPYAREGSRLGYGMLTGWE